MIPCYENQAAQASLSLDNFIGHHTLEALQAIVMMVLRLNNRNQCQSAEALTGLAVKMAQSMGLHRVPNEAEHGSRPTWAMRREVGPPSVQHGGLA